MFTFEFETIPYGFDKFALNDVRWSAYGLASSIARRHADQFSTAQIKCYQWKVYIFFLVFRATIERGASFQARWNHRSGQFSIRQHADNVTKLVHLCIVNSVKMFEINFNKKRAETTKIIITEKCEQTFAIILLRWQPAAMMASTSLALAFQFDTGVKARVKGLNFH